MMWNFFSCCKPDPSEWTWIRLPYPKPIGEKLHFWELVGGWEPNGDIDGALYDKPGWCKEEPVELFHELYRNRTRQPPPALGLFLTWETRRRWETLLSLEPATQSWAKPSSFNNASYGMTESDFLTRYYEVLFSNESSQRLKEEWMGFRALVMNGLTGAKQLDKEGKPIPYVHTVWWFGELPSLPLLPVFLKPKGIRQHSFEVLWIRVAEYKNLPSPPILGTRKKGAHWGAQVYTGNESEEVGWYCVESKNVKHHQRPVDKLHLYQVPLELFTRSFPPQIWGVSCVDGPVMYPCVESLPHFVWLEECVFVEWCKS